MKDYIKAFVNVDGVINQVKLYSPLIAFDYSKPIKGLREKVPTPYLKTYDYIELANGEHYSTADNKEFKFSFNLENAKQGKFHPRPIATKLFIKFMAETQECEELLEMAEDNEEGAMAMAWDMLTTVVFSSFGCKKLIQTFGSLYTQLYFWDSKNLKAIKRDFHLEGIHWSMKALWCGDTYGTVLDLVCGDFLREDLGQWYKSEEECREHNTIQVVMFAD